MRRRAGSTRTRSASRPGTSPAASSPVQSWRSNGGPQSSRTRGATAPAGTITSRASGDDTATAIAPPLGAARAVAREGRDRQRQDALTATTIGHDDHGSRGLADRLPAEDEAARRCPRRAPAAATCPDACGGERAVRTRPPRPRCGARAGRRRRGRTATRPPGRSGDAHRVDQCAQPPAASLRTRVPSARAVTDARRSRPPARRPRGARCGPGTPPNAADTGMQRDQPEGDRHSQARHCTRDPTARAAAQQVRRGRCSVYSSERSTNGRMPPCW